MKAFGADRPQGKGVYFATEDDTQCELCGRKGVSCTFTSTAAIIANPRLLDLAPLPSKRPEPRRITDPRLISTLVSQNEAMADDDDGDDGDDEIAKKLREEEFEKEDAQFWEGTIV